MTDAFRIIYVTTPDIVFAETLARTVVEEKLAACANLLGGIRSFYWWDGQVQDEAECALILKAPQNTVEDLINRIRQMHPYQVPCIVSLPIETGNPDFLMWIKNSCQRDLGAG